MKDARQHIRKQVRDRRNQLDFHTQQVAATQLVEQCLRLETFQSSQNIALYLSTDGELNTAPLIDALWQKNKSIYIPVLHPFSPGHLLFLHYQKSSKMVKNKYGIAEPKLDQRHIIPAHQLDLICTPLVAFDDQCQRLGMGGGYYDRTLAPWFKTGVGAKPIGLAHDCQQIDQIPTAAWDIPLPMIVTPSKVWQR